MGILDFAKQHLSLGRNIACKKKRVEEKRKSILTMNYFSLVFLCLLVWSDTYGVNGDLTKLNDAELNHHASVSRTLWFYILLFMTDALCDNIDFVV